MKKLLLMILPVIVLASCGGGGTQPPVKTQLQTRDIQSRSFDTGDREMVMRSTLGTMQDLGFIIGRADDALGTISGTAISNRASMTVSVRPVGTERIIVRANIQHGARVVTDPAAYQAFFDSLSQSMFLAAHMID